MSAIRSEATWTPDEVSEQTASWFGYLSLGGSLLCGALLCLIWLGFYCGIPINIVDAPAAVALSLILFFYLSPGRRTDALKAMLCVLIVASSALLVSLLLDDTSWDGMNYHGTSIIALTHGWNPIYYPSVERWWTKYHPEYGWLAGSLPNTGLFTDAYPKASWTLGAVAVYTTGDIDCSKWVQFFVAFIALCATTRAQILSGIPSKSAVTISTLASLSPVVVTQFWTNYNDGLLGSCLLAEIAGLASWYLYRDNRDLIVAMVSFTIASNTKFTGLIYATMVLGIVLGLNFRSVIHNRKSSGVLFIAAVFWLGVSAPTYLRNAVNHGSPFYPLNAIDVMQSQAPSAFLKQNRWSKFINADIKEDLTATGDSRRSGGTGIGRKFHALVLVPDKREGGFGPLFSFQIGLCVLVMAYLALNHGSSDVLSREAIILCVLLLWVVITTAINPEFWWARYVPQLWLVGPLLALLCLSRGNPRLATLVLIPSGITTVITSVGFGYHALQQYRMQEAVYADGRRNHVVQVQAGPRGQRGWMVLNEYLSNEGIRMVVKPGTGACTIDYGLASICAREFGNSSHNCKVMRLCA